MEDKIGNKKVKQKCDQLASFLQENTSKKFYICSHDAPDPDSLASGVAMLRILEFFGITSPYIYYCKDISHAQNKAMQNILQLPVKKWTKDIEQEAKQLGDDAIFIFVDCAGKNQNNMSIPFDPHVVIDHHKTIPSAPLVIYDEVGACSTLMLDLMLNMPTIDIDGTQHNCFDVDEEGMIDLCTALAIGIKTDTIAFVKEGTTEYDFAAHQILTRYMSRDKFYRIDNYELPEYMFDYEQIAWENKNLMNPRIISGLGFLKSSHGDCIPYIAERFMRLEGIQTVVVFGILEDEENNNIRIRAAVRTTSAACDCDTLTKNLFGENNGGAKQGAGGAIVNLSYDIDLLDEEDRRKLWELQKSQIVKRFVKVTGK
ncbi:hypothetical protein LCGC14_1406240 [marine sediment metagenome]|uniref:DDH domain-containing protein n=1 Tax=marine sediment metagenome TaxID=412755 RepID=A0A0F9KGK8_9ZZZZ